jgi:hypothetical protein
MCSQKSSMCRLSGNGLRGSTFGPGSVKYQYASVSRRPSCVSLLDALLGENMGMGTPEM